MSGQGEENKHPKLDRSVYIRRRVLAGLVILLVIAGLFFDATREFMKITVFFGMPGLVIWSYQRRYKRFSVQWVFLAVVLVGLAIGYGFLLKGLPDKIGWRGAQREGDVLLAEGQYDQAIDKYKEMAQYGKEAKMENKIQEAMKQKTYDSSYKQAKTLVDAKKYEEARRILQKIPITAVVHGQAQDLLKSIEAK